MKSHDETDDIDWLINAIRGLPDDTAVPDRTPGYNKYRTQKDHWLGWLGATTGSGTYERTTPAGRGGRYVYNHIVEPKMLLWLIEAAGVQRTRVAAASHAALAATTLGAKSKMIRAVVPWSEVASALSERKRSGLITG